MSGKKYGIFGGTFNPPHIGHVHAAQEASRVLGLDILFIPDNIPPHKQMPVGSASAEDRLAMTQLAAQQVPGSQVLDLEIRRGSRSYTADTIEELARIYPNDELWLIVGTDMLCSLHTWFQPERIFAKAGIVALARNEGDSRDILESAEMLRRTYGARIEFVDAAPLPVSSSQIRDGLYSGMDQWLPDGVFAYIKERGLYLEA